MPNTTAPITKEQIIESLSALESYHKESRIHTEFDYYPTGAADHSKTNFSWLYKDQSVITIKTISAKKSLKTTNKKGFQQMVMLIDITAITDISIYELCFADSRRSIDLTDITIDDIKPCLAEKMEQWAQGFYNDDQYSLKAYHLIDMGTGIPEFLAS